MEEHVILVTPEGKSIGLMPKMEAHQKGLLHRAFSVFIFNSHGEMLLQQRASHKYHSPLLWTNACCSHQRLGETNTQAGKRRLKEEMGFETDLEEVGHFTYKTDFDNGLSEHEFDYILRGTYDQDPVINKEEVSDWKWISLASLEKDLLLSPEKYTVWFKIIYKKYNHFIHQ